MTATQHTASAKTPNLFLVGAAKCGTTAMASYLGQHPDIFFSNPKEPIFFGRDLEHGWRMRDLEAYLDLFRAARDERYIGEGTVWYLYSRAAAQEIKEFSPNAKIIIMLRNPVDVIYSLHGQFLFSGNENHGDFDKALRAEEKRRRGDAIPRAAHFPAGLLYSEVVRYREQIERFQRAFGPENVEIVIYDDFAKSSQASYRRVLSFLGLSTDHDPEFEVVNSARVIRNVALHRWLIKPPLDLWNPERWLPKGRIAHGLQWRAQTLRGRLYDMNLQQRRRPAMRQETRARLSRALAPEVESLSRLLDRDLTGWVTP